MANHESARTTYSRWRSTIEENKVSVNNSGISPEEAQTRQANLKAIHEAGMAGELDDLSESEQRVVLAGAYSGRLVSADQLVEARSN